LIKAVIIISPDPL